jgi:putative MATE family efflux protein
VSGPREAVARVRTAVGSLFKGREEVDLTSGSIGKPMFYLALPIVVTNLLQTAYNLADTFWVGQYSTNALAAISFAFPMIFLLISLGMGLAVAGSVLVAQHTGAGEDREAEYAASQTVAFAVVVSTVLGLAGYFLVDDLLLIFGAEPAVHELATEYMRIISLGLPAMFGFFIFISLMRGYGDTITPMKVMFGSVVLNIALDPFVIFGWGPFPELGIAGAALATIFSRVLATAVGLYIMFTGTYGVRIRLRDMRPDLPFAKKILDIGAPATVEGTGRAISVNLILIIVGMFPTTIVAAYGIGIRVFSVIFLPAIAVGQGVETMTGQNIGAEKPDRAGKATRFAATAMFGILAAMGVLIFLAAGPVVGVFTDDPEVVRVGAEFLYWVAPTFGFIGVMRAYTGSFRGAGKTLTSAAISVTMLGVIRFPLAWVASQSMGSSGIWLAFAVSNVLGALIAFGWYRRGTWRDADVRMSGPTPADD